MERAIECSVCGGEFIPTINNHKIVRDNQTKGVMSMFSERDEPRLYDAFDCPYCGCQVIFSERKREMYGANSKKENTEEMDETLHGEDTDISHKDVDRYPGETTDIKKAIEESGEKVIPLFYEKSPLQEQAEQEELVDSMKEFESDHKKSMLDTYSRNDICKIYESIYGVSSVEYTRKEMIDKLVKDTTVECDDITVVYRDISPKEQDCEVMVPEDKGTKDGSVRYENNDWADKEELAQKEELLRRLTQVQLRDIYEIVFKTKKVGCDKIYYYNVLTDNVTVRYEDVERAYLFLQDSGVIGDVNSVKSVEETESNENEQE